MNDRRSDPSQAARDVEKSQREYIERLKHSKRVLEQDMHRATLELLRSAVRWEGEEEE